MPLDVHQLTEVVLRWLHLRDGEVADPGGHGGHQGVAIRQRGPGEDPCNTQYQPLITTAHEHTTDKHYVGATGFNSALDARVRIPQLQYSF